MSSGPTLTRRQFLVGAAAAGAVGTSTLLGYGLLHDAQGELPPNLSPYASVDILDGWPASVSGAAPILLLVDPNAQNPFGLYLSEILRAEGLNCFQIGRLSELSTAPLDWYDLILLTEGTIGAAQADLLAGHVVRGGGLVAMRPDSRLAPLLGVERLTGSTSESYLQVDSNHPIGQGITRRALQFHGTADHYGLAGAQTVAWLATADDLPTNLPAVTVHRQGKGQAVLWAFDLARSIAYTRQGNPEWANQERDGGDGVRAPDMFKDWVDLDRIDIPQADIQQRLLANQLIALSQAARPLPRLWYFPGTAETMLVATGDSHGNPASAIEDVLTRVERRGGHFSVYYTAFPSPQVRRAAKKELLALTDLPLVGEEMSALVTSPSQSKVVDWRARGHEFAVHPYVEGGLQAGWDRHWQEFTGLGYGPVPPTVRTHRILWTGWVETARIQAAKGMRMNLDYYHWGPGFQLQNGEWAHGHFTGSGQPQRFVDEQGRILNIYQQLTQLADDHLLDLHWGGIEKVSAKTALEMARSVLDRSLDGDYAAIVGQFHVDPFAVGGKWLPEAVRWLEGTLDSAVDRNIPICSALDWLHFTDVRHHAGLGEIRWQAETGRLSFSLASMEDSGLELTVMSPIQHGETRLVQIEVDGMPIAHVVRELAGVSYGWATVSAAHHQVVVTYAQVSS